MLRSLSFLFVLVAAVLMWIPEATAQTECPCVVPNVGGTADLMPNCSVGYLGSLVISDGLPAGDTIEISAELHTFFNNTELPGGSLGGHQQTWDAELEMTMTGTGSLAFFNRFIVLQVNGVSDSAPRVPGDAVQSFDHDLVLLEGQLFGDPDFCSLHLKAGSGFGLPSPGQTTLTRLGPPGSDFQVDSFFDVAYTIEFQGCPGSVLEGMSGTTEDQKVFQLCEAPVPVEETTWGRIKALYN